MINMKWILLVAIYSPQLFSYSLTTQEFDSEATCRAAGAAVVKLAPDTEKGKPLAKFECAKK
jgi:hypothetical protein